MKRYNISKEIISKKINYHIGVPISFSKKLIDLMVETITEGLNRDGNVKISGFGTFKVVKKRARIGRNPKTNEKYTIKSRNVISFYPSKFVKKKLSKT